MRGEAEEREGTGGNGEGLEGEKARDRRGRKRGKVRECMMLKYGKKQKIK